MIRRLIITCFVCFAFLTVSGDVLLWTVDGNATVDTEPNTTLSEYLGNLPYSSWTDDDSPYTEYLAQVAVVDNNGQMVTILPIAYQTNIGETDPHNFIYEFDPDITAVTIGHPNEGEVGAAWNQSKVYREMLEEYLFQVQILQDSSGTENIILFSDYVRGLGLDDKYVYTEASLNPLTESPWIPGVYHIVPPSLPSIPEPSSIILCMIGFGILMLKRKLYKKHISYI